MGVDAAEVHELVARRLRDSGQVYTRGRRQLVDLLLGLDRPASMTELLDRRPQLTQSSMYRNMIDLEAAGVVQKVLGADDRARFELAEEFIGHHHHLICTICGGVDDFVVPAPTERSLSTALDRAVAATGFVPQGHRLDVLGVCARCTR